MRGRLRRGDAVRGSTVVRASPEEVYEVVSDVRRIPEWSPECVRAEWVGPKEFRGWNRRRFGRWSTTARVLVDEPGREFSFAVRLGGADFTRWSYRMAPRADGCLLTEEVQMCVDLPLVALLFERIALRVKDRRTDLQGNIDQSLQHLRSVVEAQHRAVHGTVFGEPS